jgi:hypothetical protein
MTVRARLFSPSTGAALEVRQYFAPVKALAQTQGQILVTSNPNQTYSTFTSATRTTAGTTTLVSPNDNGSLIIHDLVISGERQATSTVEVRFTDGSNNQSLFLASQVDSPPNVGISFGGRIQGWRDARLDMITSGAADATVMVSYTKVPEGLPYAEWDAQR